MSRSGGRPRPGTICRTTGPCNATAGPGTCCGREEEGKLSHEDGDPELIQGRQLVRFQVAPDRSSAWGVLEGSHCPRSLVLPPYPSP